MVRITERRTKRDWAHFLDEIADQYESAEKITLVMDNLNTHAARIAVRGICPGQSQGAMGSLRFRLHPEAPKLAECGRNRVERAQHAVCWTGESTTSTWSDARSKRGRPSETTRTHASIGSSPHPTHGSSSLGSIRHSMSDATLAVRRTGEAYDSKSSGSDFVNRAGIGERGVESGHNMGSDETEANRLQGTASIHTVGRGREPKLPLKGYAPLESRTKPWATESQIEGWFPLQSGERDGCERLPDCDADPATAPLPTLSRRPGNPNHADADGQKMRRRRVGKVRLDRHPHRRVVGPAWAMTWR